MTPALSYVIPCGHWRHVDRVVGCLLEQDEVGRIELVLAGPDEVEVPAHVREAFWDVKRVPADPRKMNEARATGLLAATAPVAVIGETHCYPQPGWARAFIGAIEEGTWDGIAPQIENANPATGLSWANLVLDYGPFLRPPRGEVDALPGQNAGVRTALLQPYRDDLGERMRMPYLFFQTLRDGGARLFVEPGLAPRTSTSPTGARGWQSASARGARSPPTARRDGPGGGASSTPPAHRPSRSCACAARCQTYAAAAPRCARFGRCSPACSRAGWARLWGTRWGSRRAAVDLRDRAGPRGLRAAMSCSVVVATSGRRPAQLAALQAALERQVEPPGGFEVVVVEDTEQRGPAAVRNEGVARAAGQLLAFTDDDCIPDAGWLCALHARWAGHAGAGVGGKVVNGLNGNRFAAASQVVHDVAHAWANRDVPRFFSSNNLALPRAAFVEIGGFNERLRFAEDRELCDRWLSAGMSLAYEPAAVVRHAHRMRAGGFLAQHAGYGTGAWRFRAAQTASGRPRAPFELAFYERLAREAAHSSASVAALVVAAQVANAIGFASAALTDRGRLPRP